MPHGDESRPMKIYLVGGAVRDELLGRPVKERDYVVVGATADELLAQGFQQVGKDFPVFLHPQTKEEYALARTERKTAAGHRGFSVHADPTVTLEQDLQRRDLTINALARDMQGRLIDPYGGQQDLNNRLLRHVSPSFAEDPVRILRLARFAARYAYLGFRVADETRTLMRRMVAQGDVDELVAERVWQELDKALGEQYPSRFFQVLDDCNALDRLFPELVGGVEGMAALDAAAELALPSEVRFAALTHRLGWNGYADQVFDTSPIEGLCRRLKAPGRYLALALLLARGHEQANVACGLSADAILRLLSDADALRRPQRFEHFLQGCRAVYRSRGDGDGDHYPQLALLRLALQALRDLDVGVLVAGERDATKIQRRIRQQQLAIIERVLRSDAANS